MRQVEHLRAQPQKNPVQAMRRVEHLRAQPHKKRVQAMRRVEHLRAQLQKKQVEAMRRLKHLRAKPRKKQVQAVHWSSICERNRIRSICKVSGCKVAKTKRVGGGWCTVVSSESLFQGNRNHRTGVSARCCAEQELLPIAPSCHALLTSKRNKHLRLLPIAGYLYLQPRSPAESASSTSVPYRKAIAHRRYAHMTL